MLEQINKSSIMLDYEHEAFRDDPTILPVGKIVEARLDDRGLWCKAKLNPSSPKFDNLWQSIKGGFLKAFSIAFKPLNTVSKSVGDSVVRVIDDLQLLNVAITGNPVCQGAVMTDYGFKSVVLKALQDIKTEEKNMENIKVKSEEDDKKKKEEEKEKVEEKEMEETEKKKDEKKEKVEEKEMEEDDEEKKKKKKEDVEEKALVQKLVAEMKAQSEKYDALEAELKAFKEKPVFKSLMSETPKAEQKSEVPVNLLGLIR